MRAEVEAKFRAEGPGPLLSLAAVDRIGPAAFGPPVEVAEDDRYLDTSAGHLAATLWACRLRSRQGGVRVSLKGPPRPTAAAAPAWLHRRPEVEGPATDSLDPTDWPPSPARDMLDALRAGEPLEEVLHLAQRRTERTAHIDGRALGTLTLDLVSISRAGQVAGDLFVVELELAADDEASTADLASVAAGLAGREGLIADPRTKLEHALERLSHGAA